jgi:hypothetical protein
MRRPLCAVVSDNGRFHYTGTTGGLTKTIAGANGYTWSARVLLRRNIVIDAETALRAGAPSRPPRRGRRGPSANSEPLF